MTLKTSVQGGWIYLTMLLFLASALVRPFGRRRVAGALYFLGFLAASASLAHRGLHTGHAPMQNLFEIFLLMGFLLWPLSWLSRRLTGIETDTQDCILGVILLFPAGFVFGEQVRRLPPALQSPLFIPHVASYIGGYILLARAAVMALPLFRSPRDPADPDGGRILERATFQTTAAGFVLLTTGLILGAVWGKLAWGDYWQWDPKEMWSLGTWLVYGSYFHYRSWRGPRSRRMLALLLWIGVLFILLTVTWINLSKLFAGKHSYA